MRPVTRVIPDALTDAASRRMSATVRLGSPDPRRNRSPSQVAPVRTPVPRSSVLKRYAGPRRVSAAHETGSFSFDAGITGSRSLCANRTAPVRTSTAIADVRASETCGERSVFDSRVEGLPAPRAGRRPPSLRLPPSRAPAEVARPVTVDGLRDGMTRRAGSGGRRATSAVRAKRCLAAPALLRSSPRKGAGPHKSGCLQRFSCRMSVQTSSDAARLPDLWPVTPPSASLSLGDRDAA